MKSENKFYIILVHQCKNMPELPPSGSSTLGFEILRSVGFIRFMAAQICMYGCILVRRIGIELIYVTFN